MANEYVTLSEFKERISLDPAMQAHENRIARVLERSSRAVDKVCRRRFYATDTASARRFAPSTSRCSVRVDDFHTTTGLVVAVDSGDDGTFATTLTVDVDFELEPVNGVVDGEEGWPFSKIVTAGTLLPRGLRRNSVRVTAKWGWASVPPDVAEATEITASEMLKMHEAPFGVIGGLGDFVFRVRQNPIAMSMLAPYVRDPILAA